jgi:CRISPR/Cas system-associated exonuclease Cas4 (RecB family)
MNFDSFREDKLVQLIFRKVNGPAGISDYLKEIIYELFLFSSLDEGESGFMDLQKEYLYNVYLSVNRFSDLLAEWEPEMQVSTYLKIFRKLVRSLNIPFTGEPLKGLQVMGILETRALDFENVIVLSMNEGVFPSSGIIHSVIPFNLRRGFGLPVFEHQDRIFAYYFYRLFQRTRRIRFVYNTKTEGAKTGEMSRFLYQLKYLMNLPVKERNLSVVVGQQQQREIKIEKSDKELSRLSKYYLSGAAYLSPTALNTYLDCTLKFYFRYVAGLKEPDEVSEEVDPLVFGNLLHLTMHSLYKDFENKTVPASGFESILKDGKRIRTAIEDSIREGWLKKESKGGIEGKFLIAREVLFKYIKQILKTDMNLAPVNMENLENKYQRVIDSFPDETCPSVRIGGMIDRIDHVNGDIRIIDYKTGSVEKRLNSIESLFERGVNRRNGPAFQTLLYCWLYNKPGAILKPALYDIKGMSDHNFSPFFSLGKRDLVYLDVASVFEEELVKLIKEIYDMNTPFQQVEEPDICKNCPYVGLCKK